MQRVQPEETAMTIRSRLRLEDLEREGVAQAGTGRTLGALEFLDDEDYFLFAPEANTRYAIRLDSNADTALGLFATPELERFFRDAGSGYAGAPEIILETPEQPGVVLVEVDSRDSEEPGDPGAGAPGEIAPYALEIRRIGDLGPLPPPGEDIIGETRGTGAGIVPGEVIAEAIETPTDLDAFTVWLEEDRAYSLAVAGLDGFDPFLRLFDPADPGGPTLAEDDNGGPGRDAEILFRPDFPDFYTFDVSGADFRTDTGPYEVSVTDLGAFLPQGAADRAPDSIDRAGRPLLEAGLTHAGRIDRPSDIDLHEIDLSAGARYGFSAIGYDGLDPRIAVLDLDGRLLKGDDDTLGQGDATLDFIPLTDGTYVIEVSASFSGPPTAGDFDLVTALERPLNAFPSEARDIALLYEAGLDRQADFTGLNFWIDRFEGDAVDRFGDPLPPASLHEISRAFLGSEEFESSVGVVGELSDFQLVTRLYENVLDRPADDRGRDFWLSVLDRPGVDEADLLIEFARSGENRANNPEVEDIALIDADAGTWDYV
jgi:hypothetical protein